MILQKHARSKGVFSPLLRAGFCIMSRNLCLTAYFSSVLLPLEVKLSFFVGKRKKEAIFQSTSVFEKQF